MEMIKKIDNLEMIKWAFQKGYQLASSDLREGIHINIYEIEKYFLNQLKEYQLQENTEMRNCI